MGDANTIRKAIGLEKECYHGKTFEISYYNNKVLNYLPSEVLYV
jgi:hypothetical protein